MLSPDKHSVSSHSGSDLELNIIVVKWGSRSLTSLIDDPTLVGTVVAVPEDNVSVVVVSVSMDIEALSSVVSEVSSRSIVPSDSISVVSLELSHDSSDSNSELVSSLVGKSIVSS